MTNLVPSNAGRAVAGVLLLLCVSGTLPAVAGAESGPELAYSENGALLKTPSVTVFLDHNGQTSGPLIRFPANDKQEPLRNPRVTSASPTKMTLECQVVAPDGTKIAVVRELALTRRDAIFEVIESFEINPSQPLSIDVEIERPFLVKPQASAQFSEPLNAVLALKNGWAKTCPLRPDSVEAEYRLGHALTGKESPELALPTVTIAWGGGGHASVLADPMFSALFACRAEGTAIAGAVRYRYAGGRAPLKGPERRRFGFRVCEAEEKDGAFEGSVDAFFRMMLPDVPAGPSWLHTIAMVDYDYLSDAGEGWTRDVNELARLLTPEERARVALCFHGWYDALGPYCYDAASHSMKNEWVAMARTRKVSLTQDEVKRRLRLARALGFRVLMYFADGMAQDSGVPGYQPDWDYRDDAGKPISGWQGPDTFGPTYMRNVAHPQVTQWYKDYLDALLRTYGADVDGFVWDETFHVRTGMIARTPEPAYCDRAMMELIKFLTARVEAFDPQKVFLASDDVGLVGEDVPGYAMMADGTYQDSWCHPKAWSYGLFPNWRNTLWSCNWSPITSFPFTQWGVERFGVPVAISNGWGDDKGASEWSESERAEILSLFHKRLGQRNRPRFLTEDPNVLLSQSPAPPAASEPK